jgi:hypothetical protein
LASVTLDPDSVLVVVPSSLLDEDCIDEPLPSADWLLLAYRPSNVLLFSEVNLVVLDSGIPSPMVVTVESPHAEVFSVTSPAPARDDFVDRAEPPPVVVPALENDAVNVPSLVRD